MGQTIQKLTLVVIALAFVLSGGLFLAPGRAHAIQNSSGILCDSQGNGICIYPSNTTNKFYLEAQNQAPVVYKVEDDVCNGSNVVTSTCPLTGPAAIYNAGLSGDRIVFFETNGPPSGPASVCLGTADGTGLDLVQRSCPGDGGSILGDEWIQDGNYSLINVSRSNYNGYLLYMTSEGGGSTPVTTHSFVENSSQWAF